MAKAVLGTEEFDRWCRKHDEDPMGELSRVNGLWKSNSGVSGCPP
jgi:hypothetical protein